VVDNDTFRVHKARCKDRAFKGKPVHVVVNLPCVVRPLVEDRDNRQALRKVNTSPNVGSEQDKDLRLKAVTTLDTVTGPFSVVAFLSTTTALTLVTCQTFTLLGV